LRAVGRQAPERGGSGCRQERDGEGGREAQIGDAPELRPDPLEIDVEGRANRISTQAMKITQPSRKWLSPSAWEIPNRSTITPMMAMRTVFIITVIGAAESSSTALCQVGPL
jgi:hypothetical protein